MQFNAFFYYLTNNFFSIEMFDNKHLNILVRLHPPNLRR